MKVSQAATGPEDQNNENAPGAENTGALITLVVVAVVATIALLSADVNFFNPDSDVHLIGSPLGRVQILHGPNISRNVSVIDKKHGEEPASAKTLPSTPKPSKASQSTPAPNQNVMPSSTAAPPTSSGKRTLTFWNPRTVEDVNKCLQNLHYKTETKAGGLITFTPMATPGKNGASINAHTMLGERRKYENWNKKGRLMRSVTAQQVNAWASGSGGYPGFHPSTNGKTKAMVNSINRMLQKKLPPDRPYKTCAIIGGGYRLKGRKLGAEIDAHEAVIRVNEHKVEGYQEDVGYRTTFRIMHYHVVYGHLAQYFRSIYYNETPTIPFSEYFLWGFDFNFWDVNWKETYAKVKGANNMQAYFMGSYKDLSDPVFWPHKIDHRMMKAIDEGKWTFYKWRVPPNPPPIPGIRMNAVDNTGEGVWYNAMGYCEKISLYGFTSRGDETEYSYYW